MNDTNITNTIFNNSSAMNYLVANTDLVMQLKELSNYSSTLVPKLLDTTLYTEKQKYDASLPFYLYSQGVYSTNLFSPTFSNGAKYNNSGRGCSDSFVNRLNENGYIELSISSCPSDCAYININSSVPLNVTNYIKQMINGIYSYDISSYTTDYYSNTSFKICHNGTTIITSNLNITKWWLE